MLAKHFLTISLLLPFLAMSATARAGTTITDKSYWPSAAKHSVAGVVQSGPRDAFTSSDNTMRSDAASATGGSEPRYHGGPKSPW